jgi:hypothetical protein
MSELFSTLLVIHVIIGILGVGASYAILLTLLKRKPNLSLLRIYSLTTFLSFLISWGTGGYYYVFRYGDEVKPVIKEGLYPWAHTLFMEAKEHIFLFLPVMAFTTLLALWAYGEGIVENNTLRRALILIAVMMVIFGTFITASGIFISGAAGT